MLAKKRVKKNSGQKLTTSDWRESLRQRLRKVPEIEGLFVVTNGGTVHVFSVFEEIEFIRYKLLMKQEGLVEKDNPLITFDFHTRVHQGRPPHRAAPHGAEAITSNPPPSCKRSLRSWNRS